MRERTITVDINKNYHKSLNYKQYDNNNVLNIIIKEDDNLVDITNYTARAFYQLPSKTVIQRNTTKNGKNTIKLKIDKVILAESGRISLEVVINNVDTVVTTFTLFIDVEKSIDRNEAIEGYPEWDIIADGLSHLDDVENRMSIAENEIIDARDGETSLKARLDKDIEKAKQVYVNVEGSNISTDSSVGYLKDIEILGNTIQDAENLADIRSVGDKVEGQELYKIDVVSRGKNLFSIDRLFNELQNYSNILKERLDKETFKIGLSYAIDNKIFKGLFKENTVYIFSKQSYEKPSERDQAFFNIVYTDGTYDSFYAGSMLKISKSDKTISHLSVTKGSGTCETTYKGFMIEEGTQSTPYEPYQEDKLTILSPVQLEKVGDVADRIIEKDGVWGVEKNVKLNDFPHRLHWNIGEKLEKTTRYHVQIESFKNASDIQPGDLTIIAPIICNKFPTYKVQDMLGTDVESVGLSASAFSIRLNNDKLTSLTSDGVNDWIYENGLKLLYQTTQPTFIPLPHDQQVKLRTFAGQTNIHFETEIEPTLKAQVPKSIGATVNSHTEQIGNLSKELDRVKKLEESTVSTVTTESDFTTVEETSNGYFEDVKLEGKTLVNLFSVSFFNASSDRLYSNYTSIHTQNLTTGKLITAFNFSSRIVYLDVYNDTTWVKVVRIEPYKSVLVQLNGTEHIPRYLGLFADGWEDTEVFRQELGKTCFILEGDHTQNPPSYFEGLMSVGDGVGEVSVESMEENIVKYTNKTIKSDGYACDFESISSNDVYYHNLSDKELRLHIKKNDTYAKNIIIPPKTSIQCELSDGNVTYCIALNTDLGWGIQEYDIDHIFAITRNGSSDKKRLLYYNNETQTWEKPILRQWDSIEKHADGKYYYHQRSGEIVLNGNEFWELRPQSDSQDVIAFNGSGLTTSSNVLGVVCDKFPTIEAFGEGANFENIFIATSIRMQIRVLKSKLSTQDVNGFKQWLSQNPVTVVYQLAQEKVYECTNIDLITYANETNYVVESGAISPKTTLKVMSNISNTVRELQRKVSTLESYIQYVMIDALNNALNE